MLPGVVDMTTRAITACTALEQL